MAYTAKNVEFPENVMYLEGKFRKYDTGLCKIGLNFLEIVPCPIQYTCITLYLVISSFLELSNSFMMDFTFFFALLGSIGSLVRDDNCND